MSTPLQQEEALRQYADNNTGQPEHLHLQGNIPWRFISGCQTISAMCPLIIVVFLLACGPALNNASASESGPVLLKAETDEDGIMIRLHFDREISPNLPEAPGGFMVYVDGAPNQVMGLRKSVIQSNMLLLSLQNAVLQGNDIRIFYYPDESVLIRDMRDGELGFFRGVAAENKAAAPATVLDAEISEDRFSIVLRYDRRVPAGAVDIAGDFFVSVDFEQVSVRAIRYFQDNPAVIKLELAEAIGKDKEIRLGWLENRDMRQQPGRIAYTAYWAVKEFSGLIVR